MRFGLFGGGRIGHANPLGDSHGYLDFIEYMKEADRLGFESVFLVEHHFTGVGQLSASLNLLSFVAAATKRIRLGTAIVVLPWHNPALLAEQVGTLDVLSGGRVDFGIGVGVARGLHVVHSEAERTKALERRRATIKNIGELARRPGSNEELVDDGALLGTPAEIIDKLHRLAEGGVEYILLTNAVATPEALREFAEEILPHAPKSGADSLQSVTAVAGTV